MKEVQRQLMACFVATIGVPLALVVAFEMGVLPEGLLAGDKSQEFLWAALLELATICAIPAALRLFKFQCVERQLVSPRALRKWATIRLTMLGLPLLANALLYELFLNATFGYMAIILLLCLCFVVPTRARCEEETKMGQTEIEIPPTESSE